MSKNKNLSVSKMQRILYTKKGLRRKLLKRISKRLADYGIDETRIDNAIEWLKTGRIKIANADLIAEIQLLKQYEDSIKSLTIQINSANKMSGQLGG